MDEPRFRESRLIEWIRRETPANGVVLVGIGDDAALVRNRSATTLLATDMLIQGVHFDLASASPREVGWKALARNVSDIAAMGGQSTVAVAAAALPRGFAERDAQGIIHGLLDCADAFHIHLVGGDLAATQGPLVLTVTLLGDLAGRAPVLRSGARPGDAVLVTGALGGSLLGKHLRFRPRQAEGLLLAERYTPHAMIDISDGLARDLHHILEESRVGATLWADRIPVSDDAGRAALASGRSPLDHALGDGEDYELLFTLDEPTAARLLADQPLEVSVARIGVITPSGATLVLPDGTERPLEPAGWEHTT
ncbi:MAG TPA: thiamine-phosphate kinase [Planctomycetota bacterium]|nr:thiamine-phosphate kinase [Planctomycetota bacterium]